MRIMQSINPTRMTVGVVLVTASAVGLVGGLLLGLQAARIQPVQAIDEELLHPHDPDDLHVPRIGFVRVARDGRIVRRRSRNGEAGG